MPLRYLDFSFNEKLEILWLDIRKHMLLEEQVLLLILVSENEQHLSQLKGLETLLQFKDLHYVMIEDHHHDEIQVEFLEQDFDIHHR